MYLSTDCAPGQRCRHKFHSGQSKLAASSREWTARNHGLQAETMMVNTEFHVMQLLGMSSDHAHPGFDRLWHDCI